MTVPMWTTFRSVDCRAGHLAEELPLLSVSQYRGVVPRSEISDAEARAEDLGIYKVCQPGDIVLNRMSAYNGALGLARVQGLVSPDYLVMRPTDLADAAFLVYLIKTPWFVGEMSSRLRGIGSIGGSNVRTPRIGAKEIGSIKFGLPSFDEQRAIADYLDKETGEIDTFIADQEQLIAILNERRAATITQAVTKGLDPNVEMKDSGVHWLGQIPASWSAVKMRYLATIGTGDSDTADSVDDGEYPFFVRSQTAERINRFSYDTEAVLTAGDGAGVGKVYHHVVGKFEAHQRVYVMRDFKGIGGRFFFYYLSQTFGPVVLAGTAKSTVESLRRPMFADFHITVPSAEDQERIVRYLDAELTEIDAAIQDARHAIELSKEHRSALISAAVTGKIDVRTTQQKAA